MPRAKNPLFPIRIPKDNEPPSEEKFPIYDRRCFRTIVSSLEWEYNYLDKVGRVCSDEVVLPEAALNVQKTYIVNYFIKKHYCSKHPIPTVPRIERVFLVAAADFYLQLFSVLKQGFSAEIFTTEFTESCENRALIAWSKLLQEADLWLDVQPKAKTLTEIRKEFQRINKILSDIDSIESPFPQTSFSSHFVDECKKAANEFDVFRINHYSPLLKQRRMLCKTIYGKDEGSGAFVMPDGTIKIFGTSHQKHSWKGYMNSCT